MKVEIFDKNTDERELFSCYNKSMEYIHKEFTREKKAYYDVVIVGGGLAGLTAALASARHGAKTAIIQDRPMFGGNASSEIRMHICGASENQKKPEYEEGGILHEIMLLNKSRNDSFNYSVWDMTLYEVVRLQQNLTAYLNTAMLDCEVSDGSITSVRCYQLTTETFYTISAEVFIDCTGIGTLAMKSGAGFMTGSEGQDEFSEPDAPDKHTPDRMGNTLLLKAVDRGHPVYFIPPSFARHFTEEELRFRPHSSGFTASVGDDSDYTRMTAFSTTSVDYGYWWLELCGKTDDFFSEYEEIRDELMSCVWGVWDHIKNGGDHGAENYDLEWVGILPGMREGRRLIGDYILTENDILENRRFDDGVTYGGWAIDLHTPGGLYDFDKRPSSIRCFDGVYEIPYRCFCSRDIKNLMMAGKIISASKLGMSSARVMGTCAAGGQAAGTAAAMCVRKGLPPRGLLPFIGELRRELVRDDCFIPSFSESDGDLLIGAEVLSPSFRVGHEPGLIANGSARNGLFISDGVSGTGEIIRIVPPRTISVDELRITFDSCFERAIKITLSDKRRAQQLPGVPPELVKDYRVELLRRGEAVAERMVEGNLERLNILGFDGILTDEIRLTIFSTNGCPDARIFRVAAYGKEDR